MAQGPNEIWTWDVTRLRTREKGVWLHLYVILDIFSRKALAWKLAHSENGPTATDLIEHAIAANGGKRPHTMHADRGSAMTSQDVSDLMVKLAVTRSHSRPKTSNDNPYSEAQFRTLKYDPWFPEKFDSWEHAHDFAESFFDYYNHTHRHSRIGPPTPASVHHGTAEIVQNRREATLAAAHRANPARFARRPVPPPLPTTAWINKPADPETPHPAAQTAELR